MEVLGSAVPSGEIGHSDLESRVAGRIFKTELSGKPGPEAVSLRPLV